MLNTEKIVEARRIEISAKITGPGTIDVSVVFVHADGRIEQVFRTARLGRGDALDVIGEDERDTKVRLLLV